MITFLSIYTYFLTGAFAFHLLAEEEFINGKDIPIMLYVMWPFVVGTYFIVKNDKLRNAIKKNEKRDKIF